jgi:hypothetical protein
MFVNQLSTRAVVLAEVSWIARESSMIAQVNRGIVQFAV